MMLTATATGMMENPPLAAGSSISISTQMQYLTPASPTQSPIRTDAGWLEIYHAADSAGRYHLGAMLSDLDHPERLITRGRSPGMEPRMDYELAGVYGNCVFSNGLVVAGDGTMIVYYGAADSICAGAVTTVDEMIAAAKDET